MDSVHGKVKRHLPHTLISEASKDLAIQLGYKPIPYYFADGEYNGSMTIYLKSGCVTMDDCRIWHGENNISFERDLGFIDE